MSNEKHRVIDGFTGVIVLLTIDKLNEAMASLNRMMTYCGEISLSEYKRMLGFSGGSPLDDLIMFTEGEFSYYGTVVYVNENPEIIFYVNYPLASAII